MPCVTFTAGAVRPVGWYFKPPLKAAVFASTKKRAIQALDRLSPGLSPGLNGTKLRGIWGILLPRRGYRIQPRVSTLGNFNLAVRPEGA